MTGKRERRPLRKAGAPTLLNTTVIMNAKNPKRNGGRHADAQKVRTAANRNAANQGQRPRPKLERTTFRTSREMDFFSEKELVTQTGHEQREWPLVFVKELIDNSLDACENADILPEISIQADATSITVSDNGPGLPASTLDGALDFTVRTSDKEAYISPCRGAQGNALKTLVPMARVVDPEKGRLIIEACGQCYVITCGTDPVTQRAKVDAPATPCETTGTRVRMEWQARADGSWPFDGLHPLHKSPYAPAFAVVFRTLVHGFAVLNPHGTITLDWFGQQTVWKATNINWSKWMPNRPMSAHWYTPADLQRLLGAYIAHDQTHGSDRLLSAVIADFDGLRGSAARSKVLDGMDLHRVRLSDLVVDGRFDSRRIEQLLRSMQAQTRQVKPKTLGIIGEDHLRKHLLQLGIEPKSFQYKKRTSKDGVPWVLEAAFGWKGTHSTDERTIFCGANWSSAIKIPFRTFGTTGEGFETTLSDMRATADEPIVFVLHLAHPHVHFADRGKSALIIGDAA